MSDATTLNNRVKAAVDKAMSAELLDEITYRLELQEENEEFDGLDWYLALTDAEEHAINFGDGHLLRKARLALIELGVYRPIDEEEMSRIVTTGNRKYDFQLNKTKYVFESHPEGTRR